MDECVIDSFRYFYWNISNAQFESNDSIEAKPQRRKEGIKKFQMKWSVEIREKNEQKMMSRNRNYCGNDQVNGFLLIGESSLIIGFIGFDWQYLSISIESIQLLSLKYE